MISAHFSDTHNMNKFFRNRLKTAKFASQQVEIKSSFRLLNANRNLIAKLIALTTYNLFQLNHFANYVNLCFFTRLLTIVKTRADDHRKFVPSILRHSKILNAFGVA